MPQTPPPPPPPPPVVAFLGPKASYTHQVSGRYGRSAEFYALPHPPSVLERCRQATISAFPSDRYDIQPQASIEDVFAAVQSGAAAHGVVPFENSTNGPVLFTLDLFADTHGRYPDILVEGEIYIAVHHCLLGHRARTDSKNVRGSTKQLDQPWRRRESNETSEMDSRTATPTQDSPSPSKPRVEPAYDISHIKKLYSHPQAWGQCKLFLDAYLKGVERQDVSSTSKAAEIVAHDASGTSAAISSKIAASVNGIDILAEGIEDNVGNRTRFFILRRRRQDGNCGATAAMRDGGMDDGEVNGNADEERELQSYKTMVSFSVAHGEPGALADSLAVFKKFHLNLTSISSRPSGETPWHYVFLVEIQGRKRADGAGGKVNEALAGLGRVARSWRWLGSWVNQRGQCIA